MYADGFATRIGPVITNEGRVIGLSLVRLTPRRPKSVADAAVELADMKLFAQIAMHDRARAADYAMGT
jgi:hypothetical protein